MFIKLFRQKEYGAGDVRLECTDKWTFLGKMPTECKRYMLCDHWNCACPPSLSFMNCLELGLCFSLYVYEVHTGWTKARSCISVMSHLMISSFSSKLVQSFLCHLLPWTVLFFHSYRVILFFPLYFCSFFFFFIISFCWAFFLSSS